MRWRRWRRRSAAGAGREIVDVLAQGERSVDELAGEISQSVANTSQHLQVLARAGLVRSRREGTRRLLPAGERPGGELWAAVRDVAARHVAEVCVLADEYLGERDGVEQVSAAELERAARARRRGRARRAAGGGVRGRPHRGRAVGAAAGSSSRSLRELPRRREIVAYCRGPYCVYADDAVRLLRERGSEGAPAGCRLPGVAARGAAGRDRRAERRPDAAAPVPERRRLVCQLPVRLHLARHAGCGRPARRSRRRLSRRGRRGRLADRGRVRDARAGRPRLRAARAGRAHRRDRVPARRRRGRVRARRARRRRDGRAREHRRDGDRDAGPCARAPRLRRSPTGVAATRSRGSCSAATRC